MRDNLSSIHKGCGFIMSMIYDGKTNTTLFRNYAKRMIVLLSVYITDGTDPKDIEEKQEEDLVAVQEKINEQTQI